MTHREIMAGLRAQQEAALAMLAACIERCPDEQWDSPIAKYPFWHVAYHTLCFVDCYLSPSDEAFETRPEFHPAGRAELEAEYPSRRMTRGELLKYAEFCREKVRRVLGEGPGGETEGSLSSASGFPWLAFNRLELHMYNMRHIQHHAGQLSAFLRRLGVETRWVKAGTPSG